MRLLAQPAAILILMLGAILTACNSAEQKKPDSLVASGNSAPSAPVPNDGVRRVTVQQAADLVAKGQAVMVDVRTPGAFAQSHIKGAMLIPNNEILNNLDQLPHDKMIVTYCA